MPTSSEPRRTVHPLDYELRQRGNRKSLEAVSVCIKDQLHLPVAHVVLTRAEATSLCEALFWILNR